MYRCSLCQRAFSSQTFSHCYWLKRPELLEAVRFIAIRRGQELMLPRGDTQFMIGDDIYFVGQRKDVRDFIVWACPEHKEFAKIVIAGGGDIGLHLAQLLETKDTPVVLVERDAARAETCSKLLEKTMVMHGDALELPGEPGLTLTAYTAEPGSRTEDALALLASWAATEHPDVQTVEEEHQWS